MVEYAIVTGFGQINEQEVLVIEKSNGCKFIAKAKQVLNKGKECEEIVFCKRQNDYFIVSKLLDGTSWVKNVTRLIDVEITAITNTTKSFIRH